MRMTDEDLADIEARANESTPGPLETPYDATESVWLKRNHRGESCWIADFLAARGDVLALVAEVRQLRAEMARTLRNPPTVEDE